MFATFAAPFTAAAVLVSIGSLAACSYGPHSASLTIDDLQSTATELAAKLSASDFLKQRTSGSPRMVIALNKVENLSNDLIPSADQWYMMVRLRDATPVATLRRDRNMAFVIPREHLQAGQEAGDLPADFASQRAPTHEMTATFRSARRSAGLERTEGYDCEFRITDLSTREVVFADNVSFKRIAHGLSYD
jgi:hypothetical protein